MKRKRLSKNEKIRGKKKFNIRKMINYENVKEIVDKKLITNLNNQTFFKNDNGTYPSLLYAALDNRDIKLIEYLLENGADPNIIERRRGPFLLKVIESQLGRKNFELIKKLIDAGADIDKYGKDFCNGSYKPLLSLVISYCDDSKIAELLIKSGAYLEPQCVDPGKCEGCNPLQCAVQRGKMKIIDLLLEKDVNVNNCCKESCSIVSLATRYSDVRLLQRLLDRGADVNAMPFNASHFFMAVKGTALHAPMDSDYPKALQVLLNHELTNVNLVHPENVYSALHCAVVSNCPDSIEVLLDANPDVNLVSGEKYGSKIAVEMIHYYIQDEDTEKLADTLKKHIVKLRAAGFYLIDRNLSAICEEKFDNYYKDCCQQVDLMKISKITPASHLNFYDILFIDEKKLALCLESLDEFETLKSEIYEKFPSYAGMINFKLNRGNQWKKLRKNLIDEVFNLFNCHVPTPIMEGIFKYFSDEELVQLPWRRKNEEINTPIYSFLKDLFSYDIVEEIFRYLNFKDLMELRNLRKIKNSQQSSSNPDEN